MPSGPSRAAPTVTPVNTTDHARQPSPHRSLSISLALALATLATWAALLAWDNDKTVVAGQETGPYESWQVGLAVLVLAVLLVLALLAGARPLHATVAVSATFTACMAASFTVLAPPAEDASLWPIGTALVAVGMTAGSTALAALTSSVRRTAG